MNWLWRALAGLILWAVLFSAVYALHGAGCALGWRRVPVLFTDWHHLAMWLVWGVGLVLHVILLRTMPQGVPPGRSRWLIVAGAWIGLGSTLFTLFPVIATSTCL